MEFLIRILILFHSWLITFFFLKMLVSTFFPEGSSLVFEGQSRWREEIGDRAEHNLSTGLLASDLKKNQFLAVFSSSTIAAFS